MLGAMDEDRPHALNDPDIIGLIRFASSTARRHRGIQRAPVRQTSLEPFAPGYRSRESTVVSGCE